VESGKLAGCETLVRWQHPTRGLLLPADFIGMLVKSPLSVTLGEWIIRSALAQVRQWQVRSPELRVSINLFPRQLTGNSLETVIRESAGGDAGFVELEVDEPLLAVLVQDMPVQVEAVRRTGASFIIDHYGRTLGAINLLRHSFVAGFKIDKSLTHELNSSMRVRMMYRSITALGKSLGIRVAAEGVEDKEQIAFVTSAGCHIMQGNGLCRPLTPADFEAMLCGEEHSAPAVASGYDVTSP